MSIPTSQLSLEEKRALARKLLAQKATNPAAAAPKVTPVALEDDEGLLGIEAQKAELARLDLQNPYFRGHDTVNSATVMMGNKSYINFAGYNYLGFSGHPRVSQAAKDAIDTYGTSVSASRVASGEIPLHGQLERKLAALCRAESAIVYVSGYGTNVSTIGHLFGPQDLILHDALIHNSALIGAQLSGARRQIFRHNDMVHLEDLLRSTKGQHRRVLIVAEGVYSMDGDIAPLDDLIRLKKQYNAVLMVDEAHSMGVLGATGRGIGELFDIQPQDVDLWMGTLSKSFASCGGYIAGSTRIIEYLRYSAPGFVYSVGLSPPDTAAALAAADLLEQQPSQVLRLRQNSELFLSLAKQAGLDTGPSGGSGVVPVIVGSSGVALRLAEALGDSGINVQPIFYPAVEADAARLRFFISSTHSSEQIEHTIKTIARLLKNIRALPPLDSPIFGDAPQF